MGLAGPKNKTKIGHDPRNTHWATNSDRFGHKLLTQQGWTPGNTLGASSNSEFHTDASYSHIRVQFRADNQGIGADTRDECTGLENLIGILGRLNGKEEEVKADQNRRIVMKMGMRWVRGETLVGNEFVDQLAKMKLKRKRDEDDEGSDEEATKKAKAEDDLTGEVKAVSSEEKSKKKDKKEKRSKKEKEADKEERRRVKKEEKKKRKKGEKAAKKLAKKSKDGSSSTESSPADSAESTPSPSDETTDSKSRKSKSKSKSKSKDKKDKKDKKEKKSRSRSKSRSRKSSPDSSSSSESESDSEPETKAPAVPSHMQTGRHFLRARFIAAKRSSMMDENALREILMVKA